MAYPVEFPSIASVRAYVGVLGCGKTEALAARVAEPLEQGAEPADVLVLRARASAVAPLRARIAAETGDEAARALRVSTARAEELALIQAPGAREFLCRGTRLLNVPEERVFMEDMQACGVKRRRLREMLRFFWRSLCDLDDRDPSWLVSQEERRVLSFARAHLGFMGAVHPAEVANLACGYLEGCPGVLGAARVPHVVVDDYQCLSRASQLFVNLLAARSLTVACDSVVATQAEDPYPYLGGFDELALTCTGEKARASSFEVVGTERSRQPADLARATGLAGALGAPRPAKEVVGCEAPAVGGLSAVAHGHMPSIAVRAAAFPADEFALVAEQVGQWLACGVDAESIYVAVPNDGWGRGVRAALGRAGVPTGFVGRGGPVDADVRRLDRCVDALAYEALRLVADPADACAWRCWCGMGEPLAGSYAFEVLRARAEAAGCTFVEALADLCDEEGEPKSDLPGSILPLAHRYAAGRELIGACASVAGEELLCAVVERVPGARAGLADGPASRAKVLAGAWGVGPDDTAPRIVARVDRAAEAPEFARDAVRVGSMEALLGQVATHVVLCGCVNGILPPHACFDLEEALPDEQAKLYARAMARLYGVLGVASQQLVVTYFTRIALEDAERLDLKIDRIAYDRGRRVSHVSPSALLADLGIEASAD